MNNYLNNSIGDINIYFEFYYNVYYYYCQTYFENNLIDVT